MNSKSLDGLVAAFAADAAVTEVSREMTGYVAMRQWVDNEVIGGALEVLEIEPHEDGARLLMRWAPAGSGGWRAYYDFEIAADGITRADQQYAD